MGLHSVVVNPPFLENFSYFCGMNEALKKIIFKKLYDDLSHVEIIHHNDNIWFIDREQKYCYFTINKRNNTLWWRFNFFSHFFSLFSLERKEFEPILLNFFEIISHETPAINNIRSFYAASDFIDTQVGQILNHKDKSTSIARIQTPLFL